MSKSYSLGLDPDAVPDWGIQEGLREAVQNWNDNKEESTYSYENGYLKLRNDDTMLPSSILLTGNSGKRGDNTTVGRHGDGYGSSLVVFLREHRNVTIINGPHMWVPQVSYCDNFNADLIEVVETEFVSEEDDYYEISIEITDDEWEDLKERFLPFQDDLGETFESDHGTALLDERFKSKLYCGGIYVTEITALSYGYDFPPQTLSLDRDRQAIKLFDIQWITKEIMAEMSYEEDHVDTVFDSIVSNKADMLYMDSSSPSEELVTKCHDNFVETYGEDAIVAGSAFECENLKRSGYKKVVYLGNNIMTALVQQSPNYVVYDTPPITKSRREFLEEFLDKHQANMDTVMYQDFEDMVENVVKA